MSSVDPGQRVFNAYHHLDDQTLPYDLWRDEIELAAMVYLLTERAEEDAIEEYTRAVQGYNESNARIGVRVRPFCATSARQKMALVAAFIDSLPEEMGAAAIYRRLVG